MMKSESHWLSVKPIAETNLPDWIREIQADVLRDMLRWSCCNKSVAEIRTTVRARLHDLETKRDDFSVKA